MVLKGITMGMNKFRLISGYGQATVEFMVFLPLLIFMGILVIDAASLVSAQNRLNAAVREGAKLLSETGDRTFGSHPDCSLNFSPPSGPTNCNAEGSRCCDALQRAYRVAVESGVRNLQLEGRWTIKPLRDLDNSYAASRGYRLFNIRANAAINMLLGLGGNIVRAEITAYGGEVQ